MLEDHLSRISAGLRLLIRMVDVVGVEVPKGKQHLATSITAIQGLIPFPGILNGV